MIEILLLVMMILLAKHGKGRRKMGRYIRGKVEQRLDIGTLAANTLTSIAFEGNATERTLISSVVAIYSLSDVTPLAGQGPIIVGLAHSDYTDAEIEQWLENQGSWEYGDKIA